VPSIPKGGGVPVAKKGGFPGIITTLFIIIVCVLVGGGIYYFVNQAETSLPSSGAVPSNGAVDIMPPSIQNVLNSAITETGATVNWETDKSTRGKFEYWKTETDVPVTRIDENLSQSHSVTLTGLEPGTTYYFKITSTDATGNETTVEGKLTTLAAADETAPTISAVNVASITESGAIVTWVTDEPATSWVEYGTTEAYGSSTAEDTTLSKGHSVALTGLEDDTTYYFKIISKDASGNEATLADNQPFTTKSVIPVGYEEGNLAPDFSLKDVNGRMWTLSDFKGKIVVVNFWATWCEPCVEELPYFQAISGSEDWSGDLQIFAITAIDTNQSERDVKNFLQDNAGYTFTVLLDPNGGVAEEYGFTDETYIPRTFFIDAEGVIKEIQEEQPFSNSGEIEDILRPIQTQ
jgi:peroxiredoxin